MSDSLYTKLKNRIHTLEVYLEGAVNYLILSGDVNNPIIKDVENILNMKFNRNPNDSTVYHKLSKATEIIEKLISQNRKEWVYSDVREEAEQFLDEIKDITEKPKESKETNDNLKEQINSLKEEKEKLEKQISEMSSEFLTKQFDMYLIFKDTEKTIHKTIHDCIKAMDKELKTLKKKR